MRILKKLYIDGFVLALVGAVALGALIPTSGGAAEILSWATKLAVALLFFMYSAGLPSSEVWAGLRGWRLQITALVLTFVMYPALGVAISAVFGRFLPDDVGTGIVFLALVSATVQTCISYTSIARGNVGAAVVAASMSSTVGVFATPLLVAALLATSGAVQVDLTACIAIVVQLLLPFLVGQLVHRRIGGFMKRHDKVLKRADRSFILLVVFSAFSAGTAAGIWESIPPSRFALIAALCVGLFATALALAVATGRLLGLARADRVVLLFVGTSKSVTTGLPIAAVLFPPDRATLIVLPLMIYYQVQLISATFMAQRLSRHAPAEESAPSALSPACVELLDRLGVKLPSGGGGAIPWVAGGVEEMAPTTPEKADVIASGERHDDARARWHLAPRMATFAAGNVGALVVEADARPALERFATSARTTADQQQLIEELRSAGLLDGGRGRESAFAALLTAAGEHPIRVVGFDTRVDAATGELRIAEGIGRRLQTANPQMAALITRVLAELPPGKKVVALAGAQRANSFGGGDDFGAVSIDQLNGNRHAGVDLYPGDAIYYPQHVCPAGTLVSDESIFVYEPAAQHDLARP